MTTFESLSHGKVIFFRISNNGNSVAVLTRRKLTRAQRLRIFLSVRVLPEFTRGNTLFVSDRIVRIDGMVIEINLHYASKHRALKVG